MRAFLRGSAIGMVVACSAPAADSTAQVARTDDAVRPSAIAATRRTAITDAVGKVAPAVVTVQTEVVQREIGRAHV